jgi:antagonist of KipI
MFEVMNRGMMTIVQDLGRPGYGSKGIPPSGAFDAFSLKVGNLLLKNPLGEAGLEVLGTGFQMKAITPMAIAITGGDLSPKLNGKDAPMWRSILVDDGDVLGFSKMKNGCRAYVTVSGGIDVPPLLGSKATFLRGGMGGYEGRMLRRGALEGWPIGGSTLTTGRAESGATPGEAFHGHVSYQGGTGTGGLPLYGRKHRAFSLGMLESDPIG